MDPAIRAALDRGGIVDITTTGRHPRFTLHLKQGITAELPATARIVTDEGERRDLLVHVARSWNRTDVDAMVAWSPLIEVTVPGYARGT